MKTVEDVAAELLKVSPDTVRRYCKQNRMQHYDAGTGSRSHLRVNLESFLANSVVAVRSKKQQPQLAAYSHLYKYRKS